MMPKATPQDPIRADTVDDLIRRCRDLRADLEAAAVREAELRRRLQLLIDSADVIYKQYGDGFYLGAKSKTADEIRALLANPSPLALAAGAVLGAVLDFELHDIDVGNREAFIAHISHTAKVYLALRDSMPLGYGTPETDVDGGAE